MKIPAGKYRAKAVNGDFGVSRQKGTPFVRVGFAVLGELDGVVVNWDGWVTDNTRQRVVESLRLCGCTFPGDDVTNLDGLGSVEVEVVVEDNDYEREGELVEASRVAWVNSLAGTVMGDARMDDAARARFAAQMKGEILRVKQRGPAPAAALAGSTKPAPTRLPARPAQEWDGQGVDPNDIPF